MRALACLLAVIGSPAAAWTFTETDVCTLSHSEANLDVMVVFDPVQSFYSITLTRPGAVWPSAPSFGLQFDGPRRMSIGTDRHTLSDGNRSLTVADSGFGNVLDGLQYNTRMTALTGDRAVSVSTIDAAEPVAAFRECPSAPVS